MLSEFISKVVDVFLHAFYFTYVEIQFSYLNFQLRKQTTSSQICFPLDSKQNILINFSNI
jgi:hypothetical protein